MESDLHGLTSKKLEESSELEDSIVHLAQRKGMQKSQLYSA